MLWECCECGARLERARPTAVCRCCGTAGAVFVPAESGLELDAEAASLRESWFNIGFERIRSYRDLLEAA